MNFLVRTLGNGLYKLEEDIFVILVSGKNPHTLMIPKGFITDWASIPSLLHWLVDPTDPLIMKAALVHDWLYCTHMTSRQLADSIFYQVMRTEGMPRMKAKMCFWSVQLFGKNGYQNLSPVFFKKETPELYDKYYTQAFDYEEVNK